MSGPNLDEYLQQGIHGPKETNPDERRRFLGTLRERVIIALTQAQMREQGVYKDVISAFKNNQGAQLFLNGNMNYKYLSKYTKLSNEHNIEYTIVTNKDFNSELGLVLARDYAVDKEEIFVTNNIKNEAEEQTAAKKNLFSNLFGRFKRG